MSDCDCTYNAADIDTLVNDLQVSWAEVAELKAKLAKAVEALDRLFDRVTDIRGIDMYAYCPDELHNASAILDELKGDKT
jgi:hypothetical protein